MAEQPKTWFQGFMSEVGARADRDRADMVKLEKFLQDNPPLYGESSVACVIRVVRDLQKDLVEWKEHAGDLAGEVRTCLDNGYTWGEDGHFCFENGDTWEKAEDEG